MNYDKAKSLTKRHGDDRLSRHYMDSLGAFSDQHEAKTAGYSPCDHRFPHRGYDYTAVKTSKSHGKNNNYAYYSLWARGERGE